MIIKRWAEIAGIADCITGKSVVPTEGGATILSPKLPDGGRRTTLQPRRKQRLLHVEHDSAALCESLKQSDSSTLNERNWLRKGKQVRLTVGSKVIYPSQGPCLIGSIVEKVIGGSPVRFYQLVLLGDSGGELFIPVEKAQGSGLRLLSSKAEILELLGQFKQPASAGKSWRQRAIENSKRLTSGLAFDLAEIIGSLTALSERKELSFHESRMLSKARKLLVDEIAEVLRATKSEAEGMIDRALKAQTIAEG